MTFTALWSMLTAAWQEWTKDNAPRLGAALAYYTLFSLAPLLVIVIAIAALVFGREAAQGQIVAEIQGVVGETSAKAIQTMIDNARAPATGMLATILSLLTLLLGATGVVGELKATLNTIWNVEAPALGLWGTVKARVLSLAFVLGLGFLLLVSLVVSALLSGMSAFMSHLIASSWLLYVWQVVNFVVSLGVITLGFALLYRFVPDTMIPWRDVWVGAGITALLFVISKTLIGLYLGHSSIGSSYGPAGGIVLILVWIYYAALVFLFGAELTEVYAHRHGSRAGAPTAEGRPQAEGPSRPRPLGPSAAPQGTTPVAGAPEGPSELVAGVPVARSVLMTPCALAVGLLLVWARRRGKSA